jgi:hypothetical protein
MIDNRTRMVPLMYIGRAFERHPEWVDRLYGTGIIWTPENNIQMVPHVQAKMMLSKNPDCYRKANVKDVKNDVSGKVKVAPADTSEIERMISSLNDVNILANFALNVNPKAKIDKTLPLPSLKKEIISMVRLKEEERVRNQVVSLADLIEAGEATVDRMDAKEKAEMDASIAKQNLANIISGMDNKDSLAEYVMGTPDLEGIVVDKRNTVEKIQETILEALRAKGKVF